MTVDIEGQEPKWKGEKKEDRKEDGDVFLQKPRKALKWRAETELVRDKLRPDGSAAAH